MTMLNQGRFPLSFVPSMMAIVALAGCAATKSADSLPAAAVILPATATVQPTVTPLEGTPSNGTSSKVTLPSRDAPVSGAGLPSEKSLGRLSHVAPTFGRPGTSVSTPTFQTGYDFTPRSTPVVRRLPALSTPAPLPESTPTQTAGVVVPQADPLPENPLAAHSLRQIPSVGPTNVIPAAAGLDVNEPTNVVPALVELATPHVSQVTPISIHVKEAAVAARPSEDCLTDDREFDRDRKNTFPIDLANALRLGGANNLQIDLAREKTIEADHEWRKRKLEILPSIWYGVGYNKHDGRIQATEGEVVNAGRNSLFLGGGAGLSDAPLAGGSGGPSRLVANLSVADAVFNPLVGRQLFEAQVAGESVTMNDELLAIAEAYYNLVESYALLANARSGLDAAQQMARLTRDFAQEGRGLESDALRSTAEEAYWQQQMQDAKRRTVKSSAELARRLNLDPRVRLLPVEDTIVPVELIDEGVPVEELVATGLGSRPELAKYSALVEATVLRLRQACVRPWLPHVQVGASAGSFGGGPGTTFDGQGSRADVDVLAVWELRNLGFGNIVEKRKRRSEVRQAEIEAEMIQQTIMAEVVIAAADVASFRRQMTAATKGVKAANKSYKANFARVREAEGLPIELLQAVRARTAAQNDSTRVTASYNRAQYQLLRAMGQPPLPTGVSSGNNHYFESEAVIEPPQPLPLGR